MQYRLIDHTKNPVTKRYLIDLYEMSNEGVETIYVCAPTGGVGITVVLSGETSILLDGTWEKTSHCNFFGLIRKTQSFKMMGDFREITTGFTPQVLQLLFKERISDLPVNVATDLCDLVDGKKIDPLIQGLQEATTDEEILGVIAAFILDTLLQSSCDPRLDEAYRLIMHAGIGNIEAISHRLNLSSSMLRMLFRDKLGVSPKELVQFSRIKRALNHRVEDIGNLTSIGYESDFYDQSHFIRDFKKTIGIIPKQYYKNKNLTHDFYNFGRWRSGSFER